MHLRGSPTETAPVPATTGNARGPKATCRAGWSGPHSAPLPADYGAGRRIVKREGMRAEATGRARMHRSLGGAGAHDSRLSLSSCRIHGTTRFQLAPVRSTTFLILQKILNGKRLGGSIGEFALAGKR
jgi:hypothetical protein